MASSRVTRMRAVVRGRVQGVGFRAWAGRTAARLALTGGRARNLPDGTVEVTAEAEDRNVLEALRLALHQGPSHARVDAVEATWEENVEPRFTSFGTDGE